MTDQSRVEATARAIAQAAAKREFGPRYEGYESSHREMGEAFAQAAIEANDKWLEECRKEQAKLTPKYCPKCGHPHGQRMVWAEEVDR